MKKYILTGIIFFTCLGIQAKEVLEVFDKDSKVNWTKGEVFVTGTGILKGKEWSMERKLEAHRAATMDGMRKLVATINKIHVDSEMTVEEVSGKNETIKTKIQGLIHNFTEKEVRFTKEGICQVDMIVPINGDGSISDIFLGETHVPMAGDFLDQNDETKTDSKTPETAKLSEGSSGSENKTRKDIAENMNQTSEGDPSSVKTVLLSENNSKPGKDSLISGLVIDASKFNVRPALNPRIVTDTGEEVYGFKKADRDFRRINGLVSYVSDINDACVDKRVIEIPYVIDAKGINDEKPCIIIVSEEEAKKFLSQKGCDRVISHCRVIIVTDNKSGQDKQPELTKN